MRGKPSAQKRWYHWLGVLLAVSSVATEARRSNAQGTIAHRSAEGSSVVESRYDVVSIVPNKSDSGNSGVTTHDATFSAENVTLKNFIAGAYGIRPGLISGAPGWADTAHFDIQAKVVDPDMAALKKMTKEQREAMLAAILEDRFQLKAHTETKLMPVYDLLVDRRGPKLKETPHPPQSADGSPPKEDESGGYSTNDTNMTANHLQISSLAEWLSEKLNRTVIDKTELTGHYDFQINFAADAAELSGGDDGRRKSEVTAPSIFTALQEQLGLKLESAKGPVETLVVDHIEMPSAN